MRTVAAVAFAAALAAQQPADPILAKLSADTTNVLVLRDPVPVLERVLASPAAAALLDAAAPLQRLVLGGAFDAAALSRQLGVLAPMIPAEVVVAAPTRTIDRASHAASLFACCAMLQMLARAGAAGAETRAAIDAVAQDHLKRLDDLSLQAWVRARDERTAEGWFDQLGKALPTLATAAGLEAKTDGERIVLRGEPFAAGSPLRAVLGSAGITTDEAPAWAVDATIEQHGATLELRIGTLAPPPCAGAQLGPAWTSEPPPLFFARVEVGNAAARQVDVHSVVEELIDADLKDEDAPLLARLIDFLDRVDTVLADQTVALRVDRGLVWEHELRHTVAPAAGDADVPPQLARLLRPEDGPFAIGCDTLDALASGAIDAYLPASLGGAPYSWAAMMRTQWEAAIDFFDGEDSAVFAPGWLVLTRAAALPALPASGAARARDIAGIALVAPLAEAGTAAAFMAELGGHVAAGSGVAAPLWREQDLGLGATTNAFDLGKLAPSLQPFVHADAFAPHWFETAGLLVLSTDPALSKALIARAHGDAVPLPHARLASWAQARGEHLRGAVAAAAKWPELAGVGQDAVAALATALAAVDLVESVAWVDGTVHRERTSVRLREPAPK